MSVFGSREVTKHSDVSTLGMADSVAKANKVYPASEHSRVKSSLLETIEKFKNEYKIVSFN